MSVMAAVTTEAQDHRWMSLALALGRRGQGVSWPNPAVGCVIVKEGRVLGRGWTQPGGRPHAEAVALAQAREGMRAKYACAGASVYVTLEPCAHHGQTPPCAQALIEAGVARVVIAAPDPDPRVCGRGVAMLQRAGVAVTQGVMRVRAERDLAGFLHRITRARPMLTLKLATSFDGRIATSKGHSQWITGPQARHYVHLLRARHDAVMVGAGTVRLDRPRLTVRGGIKTPRLPVRVMVSRALQGLELSGDSLLFPIDSTRSESGYSEFAPVWILHGQNAPDVLQKHWQDQGARLFSVPLTARGVDLRAGMTALADAGLTRIFCEGGGQLAASLLRAGLVDRLIGFTAGLALGADGLAAVGPLELGLVDEAPRFDLVQTRPIGGDILHIWEKSQ